MGINVKPCPFCGSRARLLEWEKGTCRFVIGCSNADCCIFLPRDVLWKNRMNYVSGAWADKQSLIEHWNRRFK